MYTAVVHFYVLPGNQAKAEAALKDLVAEVQANEPDTWLYLVHAGAAGSLPPAAPGDIVFMEAYQDRQAFLDHVTGPAFQGFLKQSGGLFVQATGGGPFYLMETVDRLAGFLRPQAGGGPGS